MSTQDWIVMGLWTLTLVMLLAFVLVAAVLPQGSGGARAAEEHIKDHKLVAASIDVAGDSTGIAYASTLAAVGGTFVLSLFSALATTVAFAFMKKRNGGSND